MASRAELKGIISLENQQFIAKLRESLGAAKSFSNEVAIGMIKATGALYVFNKGISEIQGTWESLKRAFEAGSTLQQISRQTGFTVGGLVRLRAATRGSGIEFEEMGGRINKMQKAISGVNELGRNVTGAFTDLGLSLDDLRKMAPEMQFQTIGKAIAAMKNPLDQAAVAMDIFGKGGGDMLKIFNNSNLSIDFSKPLTGIAAIMQAYSASMDEANLQIKRIQRNISQFWLGLAAPISGVILPILNKMGQMDYSHYGLKLGNSIATAVRVLYNAFEDNSLGEVMGASMKYAGDILINYLIGAAQTFGDAMKVIMGTVASTEFGDAMKDLLEGAADSYIAQMMDWLEPFSDKLNAVMNEASDNFKLGILSILRHVPGLGDQSNKEINDIKKNQFDRATPEGVHRERVKKWREMQEAVLDEKTQVDLRNNLKMKPGHARFEARQRILDENKAKKTEINNTVPTFEAAIGNKSTSDFRNDGQKLLEKGGKNFAAQLGSLYGKIADIKFSPSNLMDTSAAKKNFDATMKKFGNKIPGEGKVDQSSGEPIEPGVDPLVETASGKGKRKFKLEKTDYFGRGGRARGQGAVHHSFDDIMASTRVQGAGGYINGASDHPTLAASHAEKAQSLREKVLEHVRKIDTNTVIQNNLLKMALVG